MNKINKTVLLNGIAIFLGCMSFFFTIISIDTIDLFGRDYGLYFRIAAFCLMLLALVPVSFMKETVVEEERILIDEFDINNLYANIEEEGYIFKSEDNFKNFKYQIFSNDRKHSDIAVFITRNLNSFLIERVGLVIDEYRKACSDLYPNMNLKIFIIVDYGDELTNIFRPKFLYKTKSSCSVVFPIIIRKDKNEAIISGIENKISYDYCLYVRQKQYLKKDIVKLFKKK